MTFNYSGEFNFAFNESGILIKGTIIKETFYDISIASVKSGGTFS
jgi:hypothetical protein